jgi:hypothetical protein
VVTTKEIGQQHAEEASRSRYLWVSAHSHVAKICATQHRTRARKLCEHFARKFSTMAISCVYSGAARSLR